MDYFILSWTDDEGLFIQALYFITNNRFFIKYNIGGVEKKAKRISEKEFISAWETYKNY